MGGKTKQSQRTKNNARPSSSGRSAELLSSVKLDAGVVNVSGTQLPALFPSLAAPSVDLTISPELQLCLKKLNKKDPITKSKALQELSELVTKSSVDDVVAALPSWCHFYKILTADPDRKVREYTQACHYAVVCACGRRLAPQLKHVMPAWLQAQHDEHAPAMAHAQRALAKTFPDKKLPEVLSFCKEPIMSNLLDVLLGNAEPAHIRTIESSEERALCSARSQWSALRGLQYCCAALARAEDAWLWPRLQPLLLAPAFWQRAAHADHSIRAAWFGAVGSIISRFKGQFGAQYGLKALRVLLNSRESNPLVAAQLWECMLLFMHNVPDWHQYLEKKELLCKRILDVLESGGWGDARHLSNMLLLILASLPEEILTKDFYIAFFNAIFSGLEKKSILSSKSERQYWITSLEECLRYLSMQAQPYCSEVVTSVHRTWLEKVLTVEGQTRNHLIKHSAGSMANLVKYWLKQAKEGNTEKYDQLIRNFWQNFGSTLTAQIDKVPLNHEDIDKLIEAHILLLQTLKTSFIQELKKQHSIKFEVDSNTSEQKPPKEPERTDPNITERFNHNLNELVQKICSHYMEFARTKQVSTPVMSPLITLLVEFDSAQLFLGVARRLGCESAPQLYLQRLRGWLAGDAMRCRPLAHIVFMLLAHLTDHEQDAVFDTFQQFPPSVVEWCLSLSLSHPHCLSPSVRRWLRGPVVEATVTSICARVIETGDGRAKNLLMMCLNCDANGECVVSPACVSRCVAQLSASLHDVHSAALETRCSVAAQLAATLPPSVPLLTAALALTAALQRGSGRVSADTWREVLEAWTQGAAALPPPARAAFLAAAAALLRDTLRRPPPSELDENSAEPESSKSDEKLWEMKLSQMEHIVSLCPHLVRRGAELELAEARRFTCAMLRHAPSRADAERVHACALRHYILIEKLNCPYEDEMVKAIAADSLPELSKEALASYMEGALFRCMYLRSMCLARLEVEADAEAQRTWCRALLAEDSLQEELVTCMHDYAVICALHDGYAFWPHYKLIEKSKNRLKTLLDDVISETNAEIRRSISTRIEELANKKGYFWAYSRKYFEDQITLDKDSSHDNKHNSQIDNDDSTNVKVNSESDQESPSEVESKIIEEEVSEASESIPLLNLRDIITGPTLLHTLHYLQAKSRNSSDEAEVLRTQYCLALSNMYIAHAHQPDVIGTLLSDVTRGVHACCSDVIINTYYKHNHTMLYEKDISSAAWSQVVSNASICSYLRTAVAAGGWSAPARHWDFTNITLCALLSALQLSKQHWGTAKMGVLARACLRLYSCVSAYIASVPLLCQSRQPAPHVAALPAEWTDIYAPDLHHNLFALILHVLDSSSSTVITSNHVAVIDSLIHCTAHMQWERLPAAHRAGTCSLERVAGACTATLREPAHAAFKYLAYHVLKMMLKPLVLEDAERLAAWSAGAGEEGPAGEGEGEGAGRAPLRLTLGYYDAALLHLQDIVEAALQHVPVCEEVCSMVPHTDAHSLALGWLLLGDLVNQQCLLARQDLKHHYIQIYREQKFAEPLLTTSLRLLPGGVLRQAAAPAPAPPSPSPSPLHHAATALYAHMFPALPPLHVYDWCGAEVVAACACACVSACVRGAGAAAVRGWRGAAHHLHARALDHITTRYITPHVVKEEFALLQKRSSEIEDTEVTINRSSWEVRCVLTVDDKGIELVVALAPQHPLVLPRLSAPHAAAGNLNWILLYLGYQNGTILNALKMWTVGVNNKMERAPQCYICYCRLHHATGRLPGVHCRTCRNKFHNVCLRKWFLSSGKMTCPLCRANF